MHQRRIGFINAVTTFILVASVSKQRHIKIGDFTPKSIVEVIKVTKLDDFNDLADEIDGFTPKKL